MDNTILQTLQLVARLTEQAPVTKAWQPGSTPKPPGIVWVPWGDPGTDPWDVAKPALELGLLASSKPEAGEVRIALTPSGWRALSQQTVDS